MEEKKFIGPKPSYVFMKAQIKKDNEIGFYCHGMNLIYYCIKHDFNEEQVNEYLDKEIQKCKKYLKRGHVLMYHSIPYHFYKDIINTSKDDFILKVSRNYHYDWKRNEQTNEIDEYYWYDWVNRSIRYDSNDNRYKTFFRQCSEHSLALDDLFKRRGYCQCEISLYKKYDKEDNKDIVYVLFNRQCHYDNEQDFKRTCINYWHFIKLLDYINEEDINDIDIDDLYKRKEICDMTFDRTKPQVKHTKGFRGTQKKNVVWDLIKGILTKLTN